MITGIFLAAGKGDRFGSQKMVALTGGNPLFFQGLKSCSLSGLNEIIVVLGFEAEQVKKKIDEYFPGSGKIRTIINRNYERGMISSFNAGLRILNNNVDGAMMILGDMPFISSNSIDRIIARWSKGKFVIPEVNEILTHPRIIPKEIFQDFFELEYSSTGKSVILKNQDIIEIVKFKDEEEFKDIDTEFQLKALDGKNYI